jgi:hypothetical protein
VRHRQRALDALGGAGQGERLAAQGDLHPVLLRELDEVRVVHPREGEKVGALGGNLLADDVFGQFTPPGFR